MQNVSRDRTIPDWKAEALHFFWTWVVIHPGAHQMFPEKLCGPVVRDLALLQTHTFPPWEVVTEQVQKALWILASQRYQ